MIPNVLRQAAMELRSLLLLRWTLLLPAAASIWMLLHTWRLRPESSQDINLYASDTHQMLLMLTTAIPLLLGVLLMRRDLLHPSAEWLFRLPLPAGGWMAAKWLAGLAYMTLYTLAVGAAYAASALRHGLPAASMGRQLALYGLLYEHAFAVSLALGLFLGVLLPLRFSLPAAFCAWVFGSLFLQAYIRPVYEWSWLKAFYLQPLFENSLLGNEVWSWPLARGELLRIMGFGAAFSLFLLVAGAALLGRSKPPLNRRRPWLLALVAMLAAAGAFAPFASLEAARDVHRAQLEQAAAGPDERLDPAAYRFRLERMDLRLKLAGDGSLVAEATLELPTEKGRLLPAERGRTLRYKEPGIVSLLLYPSLQVRSVQLNGVPIAWERKGDSIRFPELMLDRGRPVQTVEIRYGGRLDEWLSGPGGSESYLAFLRSDALYLPASLGWYPLPGGDTLLALDEDGRLLDRPSSALTPGTAYEVEASGFRAPLFGTLPEEPSADGAVRFRGVSGAGLTLVGGRFETVRREGEAIRIVTTPGNRDEAEAFLERFERRREGLEELAGAPLGAVRQLFFFPMHLIGAPVEAPSVNRSWHAENDTLFIPQTEHRNLDGYAEDALSDLLLFGDVGRGEAMARENALEDPSGSESVALAIRSAYAFLYNKQRGPDEPYRIEAEELPAWRSMRALIQAAYDRGHAALAREVLEQFRSRGLALPEPPRSGAGERMAAAAPPYVTVDEFMKEWRARMPDDRWPPMTDDEGG
ncbi:hypothetical protein [Paenibacillus sp. B01]|uniref:hypothetical protein n=1 Tax=Paenibacillus sp. B01 TaxID=2660554 RepID=UPI00129B4966|nr:hypothetical protein [Paenibacillus sp. B01]QGG55468.1 hypothetical protein GE073_07760 [Paenibacillus sp. B01]